MAREEDWERIGTAGIYRKREKKVSPLGVIVLIIIAIMVFSSMGKSETTSNTSSYTSSESR